jgi:hypothetical protein
LTLRIWELRGRRSQQNAAQGNVQRSSAVQREKVGRKVAVQELAQAEVEDVAQAVGSVQQHQGASVLFLQIVTVAAIQRKISLPLHP